MVETYLPRTVGEPLPEDAVGYQVDEKKVRAVARKVGDLVPEKYGDFNAALSDDEMRAKLLEDFTSEPIDAFMTDLITSGMRLNIRECLAIDLTEFVPMDMLYRYLAGNEDIAINFTGRAGKGKSNIMLWAMLKWLSITKKPLRLSNIVFHLPLFNLLLKGFKVKENTDGTVEVINYELEQGDAVALDEGSDTTIAGDYSATMVSQTQDMEARMRAKQCGRFASGTRRMLHQSYYDFWAIQRDPKARICTAIIYASETNDPGSPVHFLGSARIPYVDLDLFAAYHKPKMKSIKGYARSVGTNIVAKVIKHFAEKLKEDKKYQALPIRPPAQRLNYLKSSDLYAIFQTQGYFKDLEQLSRLEPKEKDVKSKAGKPLGESLYDD